MQPRHTKARSKLLAILPLLLCCMLLFSQKGLAQNPLLKTKKSSITLSGMNPGDAITDINAILKNPHITTSRTGCTITGFQISFLPQNEDFFGPFKLQGNKLQANQIEFLRKYSGKSMRIFIEEIILSCNNKEEIEMPVIYKVAIASKK